MKRIYINNQIRAKELRVITDDGENLGIISFEKALEEAKKREMDLIEISPNAKPPVAKIMDYGKFQYQEQKKKKEMSKKTHIVEVKNVRIGLGTSGRDLELKAKKASEFLQAGDRVKVDLILRGRAKYLDRDFLRGRLTRLLDLITEEYKASDEPKKGPRGISIVIVGKKSNN